MRTWCLLALLAACGDDASTEDGARSGSRLRITWLDFDGVRQWQPEEGRRNDGSRLVNTEVYFDRERDESCAPEPWLDGVVRCTPDVELVSRKLFADAACTMRVTENPQTFRFVGDYDDKCGLRRLWHVFPVVRTMPRTELYYVAGDGTCYATPSSASELGVLGDQLAPDVFARVDVRIAPDRERVQVRSRVSDDGLVLPLGLNDLDFGSADVARSPVDPEDVAMPRDAVPGDDRSLFFGDERCTHAYVRVDVGCPAPPSATPEYSSFFEIGDHAVSPPRYVQTATCDELASPPAGEFYQVFRLRIGLAPVTLSRTSDPAHRMALQHASAGSVTLRLHELYDTALDTECVAHRFPDDVVRCAPDPEAAEIIPGIFADPACQAPLVLAHVLRGHRAPRLVMRDQTLLGGALTMYELNERTTDTAYVLGGADGITCVPADLREAYRVGRVVDWTELAVARLATD